LYALLEMKIIMITWPTYFAILIQNWIFIVNFEPRFVYFIMDFTISLENYFNHFSDNSLWCLISTFKWTKFIFKTLKFFPTMNTFFCHSHILY
jgi:hypothetical protein